MPLHTSPEEARLREEAEARRAVYQARLMRDRRLVIGLAGLVAIIGGVAMLALARVLGG